VLGAPVEETLAGRLGAGKVCVSTRPLGTALVTSPGAGRAADEVVNGLSPNRAMSALQPAAADAMMARAAMRADRCARETARERMT
jgi:predicted NAD/FAD-binding protein